MVTDIASLVAQLETNMSQVVLGKTDVVRACIVALLSGEHVLLEDVPGVGKTLVGKALAKSVAGTFTRIQFTPDLLPSDILGTGIYDSKAGEFRFVPGPIFANIVLADEINRTTPRTQSALLEAMSEGQVSADSQTHPLPKPFMVIATQNPVEFEGTYPLPESQLDRFLMRISLGYPGRQDELEILSTHRAGEPVDHLAPALNCSQIAHLQKAVRQIQVDDSLAEYLLDIVDATRECKELHVGVSTRGALCLYRAAQALALVENRTVVSVMPSRPWCNGWLTRFPYPDEMILKRHTFLCREGWYYLLVLGVVVGGSLMREINLLMVIAGMMVGPLLYNWREVVASLKGLQARRKLPEGICAGDLLIVELSLTNTSRRYHSWAVVVEDQVRRDAARRSADVGAGEVLFARVPRGESRNATYQGRILRRGRYRFGPLKVSTRFPLGLVRRTITIQEVQTMTVCPRLGHLTPAWSSLHQQTLRGARRILKQQNVIEPDFYGLREWQNGDSRRAIHWRSSARRGELVVKQSEQQREQDLLLLVDLWQPRSPTSEHRRAVELAVSFAATVVAQLCRHGGSQLDVGIGGCEIKLTRGTSSLARLNEILEDLAVAEADHEDRLSELIRLGRQEIRAGTAVLIVSSRPVDVSSIRRLGGGADGKTSDAPPGRVVVIDASSPTLEKYFFVD
jgi:MoxR-like ATPase